MADNLEGERDFYRQQYSELGMRLLRLQEDETRARREARRSRTTTRLIRDIYQLADSNISLEDIGQQFLQIILETLVVSRAALLQYVPAQQRFVARQTLGFPTAGQPDFVPPELPPEYYFANSNSASSALLDCLRQAAGAPYFLWAFNARAGLALLAANLVEDQHLHRPFEANDQEIIESALGVFIDISERKRAEEALQRVNEELESRVATRTAELTAANEQLQNELAERRRVEEALRQSEERFREVITSISDHIYMTEITGDGRHRNLYLSPHVEFLTGYPYDKFLADWSFWPLQVIHPDDRLAASAQARRQAGWQNSEMEYRLVRANGEVIWVRDSGRVQWDGSRPSKMVYGVVSDITERKRVEEELARTRDQALEANRLKSQLLASVSHDLRTPLNAILGYVEMLQQGVYGALALEQLHTLARIMINAEQLLIFVNNLLDQAQIEAARVAINVGPVAPADLLDTLHSTMNVLAEAKDLRLTSSIAAGVPKEIYSDRHWLGRILVNLVSNALKFTEKGGVDVYIYSPDPASWAIRVTDTGCGIPDDASAYIFDAFRQVDSSLTRAHSGSGLGLSIVKQLVDLMGGQIALTSQVGTGSAFTVTFPLNAVQEALG